MPKAATKPGNYNKVSVPIHGEKKPVQPTAAQVKAAQHGFSKDGPDQKKFNAAQLGRVNKKK